MNTDYSGYFDYASATPMSKEVIEAMHPYLSARFHNPSAIYREASQVREDIDEARKQIAGVLGVKQQEIIFTSGCTEANNLAINGVMSKYPDAKVLVSSIEHDSVLEPASEYTVAQIPVTSDGIVDCRAFSQMLSDEVVLVSVMYANNEVGTIQPLRELGAIIEHERKRRGLKGLPLYFHTDAAQVVNYLSLNISGLRVDMMSLNSSKVYGPKGNGCLYVSSSVQINPLVRGGGQERGLRSGTENVMGIVGFAQALVAAQATHTIETIRLRELQIRLIEKIVSTGGLLNGSLKNRLPNNINVCFAGVDNERLVLELDSKGFMVSSGSACHAKSGISSKVLEALGLDQKGAKSSIRISMGKYTTKYDVDNLSSCLLQLVAKSR